MQKNVKPKWWRSFWIQTTIAVPILIAITLALYFSGQTNNEGLIRGFVSIVFVVGFGYMVQYIIPNVLSKDKKLQMAKLWYVAFGVSFGIVINYFETGFVCGAFSIFGS